MDSLIQFKQNVQKVIDSLKEDLKSIRTGRATPSLVENLMVAAYGGEAVLKLMELATITTEGSTALSIVPFDPSVLPDIEKSVLKSPLGLSPSVQGNRIIIKIPPLSGEQREKFVKTVGEIIEEKKNQIRNLRNDVRKSVKTSFENKKTTEDEKYRLEKELNEATFKFMEEVEKIKERKIEEILRV